MFDTSGPLFGPLVKRTASEEARRLLLPGKSGSEQQRMAHKGGKAVMFGRPLEDVSPEAAAAVLRLCMYKRQALPLHLIFPSISINDDSTTLS